MATNRSVRPKLSNTPIVRGGGIEMLTDQLMQQGGGSGGYRRPLAQQATQPAPNPYSLLSGGAGAGVSGQQQVAGGNGQQQMPMQTGMAGTNAQITTASPTPNNSPLDYAKGIAGMAVLGGAAYGGGKLLKGAAQGAAQGVRGMAARQGGAAAAQAGGRAGGSILSGLAGRGGQALPQVIARGVGGQTMASTVGWQPAASVLSGSGATAGGAGVGGAAGTGAAAGGLPLLPALAGGAAVGLGGAFALDQTGATGGNSMSDQFIEGAAIGGGAGLGAGLATGGLPALFTVPAGALIGGAGNVLQGHFGGENVDDPVMATPRANLIMAIKEAEDGGLVPEGSNDTYMAYYELLVSQAENPDDTAIQEAAAQQVAGLMAQDAEAALMAPPEPTAEDIMAQQAYVANVIQPYTDRAMQNNAMRSDVLMGMVDQLPTDQRDMMRANIANLGLANDALINAYAAQAAMAPQTMAFEEMQAQQDAIAAQIQQAAIQAQLDAYYGTGSGAATDDISALLGQ